MSCNFPLKGFYTGNTTEKGAAELIISRQSTDLLSVADAAKMGYRVSPAAPLVDVNGVAFISDPVDIPCGHCFGCKMDFAKNWTTRAVLEMQDHKYNYFLTLTFDDEHCPDAISKRDLQLFFKRLRRAGVDFRYFACGEYGENTNRPHYHALLFMDSPLHLSLIGINVFHSPEISKAWPFGLHSISFSEPGCCAYVAGYVIKKQRDPRVYPEESAPFILMSRRPGLGRHYFDSHDLISSLKVYGSFGKKTSSRALPRYFKNLLGDEYKALEALNKEAAHRTKQLNKCVAGESSPESVGFYFDDLIKESQKEERKKI